MVTSSLQYTIVPWPKDSSFIAFRQQFPHTYENTGRTTPYSDNLRCREGLPSRAELVLSPEGFWAYFVREKVDCPFIPKGAFTVNQDDLFLSSTLKEIITNPEIKVFVTIVLIPWHIT
jgi:hypothetical protein